MLFKLPLVFDAIAITGGVRLATYPALFLFNFLFNNAIISPSINKTRDFNDKKNKKMFCGGM
jgi:hypothetical protein